MKKQPVFDDAEIIGLNNEETGITQGLRRPHIEREPLTVGVELDHIGTGQTSLASVHPET